MQSTKYGASEGAKSKWADVEVAEYQPGGGHVGDNLQKLRGTHMGPEDMSNRKMTQEFCFSQVSEMTQKICFSQVNGLTLGSDTSSAQNKSLRPLLNRIIPPRAPARTPSIVSRKI